MHLFTDFFEKIRAWAIGLFSATSNAPKISAALSEIIRYGYSSEEMVEIVVSTLQWFVVLFVGLVWLILACMCATCVHRSVRETCTSLSFYRCFRTRVRSQLEDIKKGYIIAFATAATLVSITLIASAVCSFVWADHYKKSYQFLKCDVQKSVRGFVTGTSAYQNWDGLQGLQTNMDKVSAVINKISTSTLIPDTEGTLTVADSHLTYKQANKVNSLFKDVQWNFSQYSHYCVGCGTAYIYEANRILSNAEGIYGILAGKIQAAFEFHPPQSLPNKFQTLIGDIRTIMKSVKWALWGTDVFVESVFGFSIAMGMVSVLATLLLWWGIGALVSDRNNYTVPCGRTQKVFAALYIVFAFLGSCALIFSGIILLLAGYSNGGCYFLRNDLQTTSVWLSTFGGTAFGVTARQCMVLDKATILMKEEEDQIDEWIDTFNKWKSGIDKAKLEYLRDTELSVTDAVQRVRSAYPEYSWIVVPHASQYPSGSMLNMCGIQLDDVEVSCEHLRFSEAPDVMSPLALACLPKPVEVSNATMHTAATVQDNGSNGADGVPVGSSRVLSDGGSAVGTDSSGSAVGTDSSGSAVGTDSGGSAVGTDSGGSAVGTDSGGSAVGTDSGGDITIGVDVDGGVEVATGNVYDTSTTAAASSMVPPRTTIVYGLLSLNRMVNEYSVSKNFCMETVAKHDPTSGGCASASPVYITAQSHTSDQVFVDEYSRIPTEMAHLWRYALDLATEKEQLHKYKLFKCGTKNCTAPDYMLYWGDAKSHFAKDADDRMFLMKHSIQTRVVDIVNNINKIVATIQKDGVAALEDSKRAASCSYMKVVSRQLTGDLCDLFFPSISTLPVAALLMILVSIVATPLCWQVYHYVVDVRHERHVVVVDESLASDSISRRTDDVAEVFA